MPKLIIIYLLIATSYVNAFWPPSYQIHLNETETFIISDMFDQDSLDDFKADDMEIIKEYEIEQNEIKKVPEKYYRLHKYANRKNREDKAKPVNYILRGELNKPKELPYEKFDYPAYAGFVDKKGQILENKNVYYLNDMVRRQMERKNVKKRQQLLKPLELRKDEIYDYEAYKKEYDDLIQKEKNSKKVLFYKNVPEEETFKESVEDLVKFKKVTNCTKEETKGVGLSAAKCFMNDFTHLKQKKDAKSLLSRFAKFVLIWFLVYLIIAIPCWCQKGWCCCCFRCQFCRPREEIDAVKAFYIMNPPGVLIEDGMKLTYKPTVFENYAQNQLEQAIMKL